MDMGTVSGDGGAVDHYERGAIRAEEKVSQASASSNPGEELNSGYRSSASESSRPQPADEDQIDNGSSQSVPNLPNLPPTGSREGSLPGLKFRLGDRQPRGTTSGLATLKSGSGAGGPSSITEGSDPFQAANIYTNLLLTEHALRSQFIELQRSRRRGLLFFWAVTGGAALLTYRVRSRSNDAYKMLVLLEQLLMVALYIALGLFFLTGMYSKVFVVAPRFLNDANKGLKSLNVKIVKIKSTFKEKIMRTAVNPTYSEKPGGLVKLVPLPRAFSYNFIEEWELFREEYWGKQRRNQRRTARKSKRPDRRKT